MKLANAFHGKIVDDVFMPHHVDGWKGQLRHLNGKDVTVAIQQRRKKRSLDANGYYWAVVVELIANHCGYLPEEAHDAMRLKFLTDNSGPIPRVKSTASLDTKEFGEYLDRCIQLGAEMGIVIPNPLYLGEVA